MIRKKWNIAAADKAGAYRLSEKCGIDPFVALVLIARGIDTPEKISAFFMREEDLGSPYELCDITRAAQRINRAVDNFERILIYGDYDADGITSTVLLYSYLTDRGADVIYYIPDRGEGYGMSFSSVDNIKEQGVSLIITVDNGVTAVEEIKYAAGLGIDVVVTDHHIPGDELPPAAAVVDPHRKDCPSRFKGLAGVGVAYKLVCALEECECGELLSEYADLLAIGTVADLMPVTTENRVFIKQGIKMIREGTRTGLRALIKAAGISGEITADTLGYYIAPRINAAGRMGNASRAVSLLMEENEESAIAMAEELCGENTSRKQAEQEIVTGALLKIEEAGYYKDRIIVVSGEGWPQGIVGIAASRILEKYGAPVIVFSAENGEAVGSGRSIKGFNLHECINSCADILVKFGGHELAAGVTIKEDDLDEFRRRVNEYAAKKCRFMPFACIDIDCKLNPKGANLHTVEALKTLEPFGSSNKRPIFGFFGLRLDKIQPSADRKHLRLTFSRGGSSVTLMKFSTAREDFPYTEGDILDVAVTLTENIYQGNTYLRINLIDMRPAGIGGDDHLNQVRAYECFCRGEAVGDIPKEYIPGREIIAKIYRYIRENGGFAFTEDMLCLKLGMPEGYCSVMLSLDIMEELSLISLRRENGMIRAQITEVDGKVDLESSLILQKLKSY